MENQQIEIINNLAIKIAQLEVQVAALTVENQSLKSQLEATTQSSENEERPPEVAGS